jgi:hypothetical protein
LGILGNTKEQVEAETQNQVWGGYLNRGIKTISLTFANPSPRFEILGTSGLGCSSLDNLTTTIVIRVRSRIISKEATQGVILNICGSKTTVL